MRLPSAATTSMRQRTRSHITFRARSRTGLWGKTSRACTGSPRTGTWSSSLPTHRNTGKSCGNITDRLAAALAAGRLLRVISQKEGETMPHVVVKLLPGKSEEQKSRLAEEITRNVMSVLSYGEEAVSVAFEEVDRQDWTEKVYEPDIQNKWDTLYKKPGYDPF